jgi:hypothetical protein
MTRKLAVTVFAMSLMLVGCGSSSTTKVDAGGDAKPATPDGSTADVVQLDVVGPTGVEAGQPDVVQSPDVVESQDAVQSQDVTNPGQPDAGVDTTIVTPADAARDTTTGTDVSTTVVDGGTDVVVLRDTGSATLDTRPDTTGTTPADAGPDSQSVLLDGSTTGADLVVVISPDASEGGSDAGAIATGDASEAGSDAGAIATGDASEAGSTVDAPASTVDAPEVGAADAEGEAGSSAVDGGGGDGSTG